MPRTSAGLLVYRRRGGALEVLLAHPGGPLWAKKDEGAWTIPKGEFEADEDPLAAARREFAEEIGVAIVEGRFIELTPLKQPSGKLVHAWAVEADLEVDEPRSNTFELEWPPRSGRVQEFPEIDRAQWFDLPHARRKILSGQQPFLDELERRVTMSAGG